jgi:dipeptidyl aminopeptidase/acylaminoacyl peptidase
MKWLRPGLIGAAATATAAAALGGVSLLIALRLVHPERARPERSPDDFDLIYEPVHFQSEDGVQLAGHWMPAGENPRDHPTVIFLHGYTQSKEIALDVAPFLVEAGNNVFAFDFRAHGKSGGETATLGTVEIQDARAAVRYVSSRPDVDPKHGIHLLGWSQGGAMAIMIAGELPEVTSVISDSGFATLRAFLRASIPAQSHLPWHPVGSLAYRLAGRLAGTDLDRNSAVAAMPRLKKPVLLIQGLADPYTLPVNVDALAAAADAEGLHVWKVPGAGHLEAVNVASTAYQERVLGFLAATAIPQAPKVGKSRARRP